MISRRAQSVDASGIRKVFDLGAKLKDPINLSIGQPDFDAFPEVKQAAHQAIDSRKNGYTVTQGIEPLREKVRARFGIGADSSQAAFLTSGVSGGLLLAYMAMLDPGDEVVVPDPFFVLYRDQATLLNAVATYYDTYPHFRVNVEAIERAITPKTRAILVGSPSNPTGYSIQQEELDAVIEVARRAGVWLIYDEIYEAFNYDRAPAKLFGKYDKTLILGGYSKSHGIPGWRIGYAVGPNDLIAQMLKIQQYSFVCTPSVVQWAMIEGLDVDLSSTIADYAEKRNFMYNALKDFYELEKPSGAFYLFPKVPGGLAGQQFVERCIENNLLVIPGGVFSRQDTHFRISFAAPMSTLERGAEILQRMARS